MAKSKHSCNICTDEIEQGEICKLCNKLTTKVKKKRWSLDISPSARRQTTKILAEAKNSNQRWRNFENYFTDTKFCNWAKLPASIDPIVSMPFSPEVGLEICESLENSLRLTPEHRTLLQDGFLMYDGTRISFIGTRAIINGRQLPVNIPLSSILRMMIDEKSRQGWNLTQLIYLLSSSDPETINSWHTRRQRVEPHIDRMPALATLSWMEIMIEEHVTPPTNYSIHPLSAWIRELRTQLHMSSGHMLSDEISNALTHYPQQLFDNFNHPWIDEWKEYRTVHNPRIQRKWPLKTLYNRLMLSTRTKSGSTNLTKVPCKPAVIAGLLCMLFSPVTSPTGMLLYSLQYNWTSSSPVKSEIPAPLARSITLLHDIINSNKDRVFKHGEAILVIGRLGHFYEVNVERGAHGAPFVIRLIKSLSPTRREEICIHEGREQSSLPLGDIIASVILSLLDDVNSSQEVDSLLRVLVQHSPLGFSTTLSDNEISLLCKNAMAQLDGIEGAFLGTGISWLRNNPNRNEQNEAINFGPRAEAHYRNYLNFMMRRNRFHQDRNAGSDNYENSYSRKVIKADLDDTNLTPSYDKLVQRWKEFKDETECEQDMSNPHFARQFWRHRPAERWMFIRNNGVNPQSMKIGDIRNGERRYCEVFPRIWDAMMRQTPNSTVSLIGGNNPQIKFQQCDLEVSIRNEIEKGFLKNMLRILGYVDTQEGLERETRYIRRNEISNNAFRKLSEKLGNLQSTRGARGAPPWWWHFRQVCDMPTEKQEFSWQLQENLRDDVNPDSD